MTNINSPKASVILSCYNQVSNIEKIFYSLLNQTFTEFEIVLADDGSGPEMFKLVQAFSNKFAYPIQHVWHEDIGYRRTVIGNRAVKKCDSDYIIFVDGDCILHHQFIASHYKRRQLRTVLSGRRIMLDNLLSKSITNDHIINKLIEKPSFWWRHTDVKEWKRGIYLPFIYKIVNFPDKNYWAIGCNFSIHKQDFIDINGYDESITGWGLEDINLSQRFKLKGYKIRKITNEAIQYHLFHKSTPVTRSKEEINKIICPQEFYALKGIN